MNPSDEHAVEKAAAELIAAKTDLSRCYAERRKLQDDLGTIERRIKVLENHKETALRRLNVQR